MKNLFLSLVLGLILIGFASSIVVEGDEYSLDLFETLLTANSGEGSEYNVSLLLDEQSSTVADFEGGEYSGDVGGYGLLSDPPEEVVVEPSVSVEEETDEEVLESGSFSVCLEGYEKVSGKCVEIINNVSLNDTIEGDVDEDAVAEEEGSEQDVFVVTGGVIWVVGDSLPFFLTILIVFLIFVYFGIRKT